MRFSALERGALQQVAVELLADAGEVRGAGAVDGDDAVDDCVDQLLEHIRRTVAAQHRTLDVVAVGDLLVRLAHLLRVARLQPVRGAVTRVELGLQLRETALEVHEGLAVRVFRAEFVVEGGHALQQVVVGRLLRLQRASLHVALHPVNGLGHVLTRLIQLVLGGQGDHADRVDDLEAGQVRHQLALFTRVFPLRLLARGLAVVFEFDVVREEHERAGFTFFKLATGHFHNNSEIYRT